MAVVGVSEIVRHYNLRSVLAFVVAIAIPLIALLIGAPFVPAIVVGIILGLIIYCRRIEAYELLLSRADQTSGITRFVLKRLAGLVFLLEVLPIASSKAYVDSGPWLEEMEVDSRVANQEQRLRKQRSQESPDDKTPQG